MDTLDLVLANDDVLQDSARLENEDSVFVTSFSLSSAGNCKSSQIRNESLNTLGCDIENSPPRPNLFMPPSKVPVMVLAADRVVAPAAEGKVVVAAAETETAPRTTETRRVVSCILQIRVVV